MNQIGIAEKLLKLLPHVAQHCVDHVHEIAEWYSQGNGALSKDVIDRLTEAGAKMEEAGRALTAAHVVLSEELGGATQPAHDHLHD